MIHVDSQKIESSNADFEYVFVLDGGKSGTMTIVDESLSDQTAAELRARSEFLDNGYKKRFISFSTYNTSLSVNDIIMVNGLKYKIVELTYDADNISSTVSVRGVRYE